MPTLPAWCQRRRDGRRDEPAHRSGPTHRHDQHQYRAQRGEPGRRISFTITGLDGATAQLSVAATGYQSLNASYTLQPAQDLDLGQIRLRPPQVTQLALDLQVQAVKRHTTQTDPQTLRVSGALQVQVRNAGTQPAPANVPVLAFQDSNGNGQHDQTDTVPGQTTLTAALGAGQAETVTIEVAGLLPFRDAPIHVVDPLGALAERTR